MATGAEVKHFSDFDADGVIDFGDSPNAEWSFDSPGIQLDTQLSLVDAEGCERAAGQLLCTSVRNLNGTRLSEQVLAQVKRCH